jgi:hypothetical protein
VWFFSSVAAHVDDQHVLSLEGFLFSAAVNPTADEGFFVGRHVVLIDMRHQFVLSLKIHIATSPATVCLNEVILLVGVLASIWREMS